MQVANTLLTSKLWYKASILEIPPKLISKINKAFFNYVWQGKTELVKRESLYMPINMGGLGLLEVNAQSHALRIKEINTILQPHQKTPSKYITLYWTRQQLATSLPRHFKTLIDNTKPVAKPSDIPTFYKSALEKIKNADKLLKIFNETVYTEPLMEGEKESLVSNKEIYNAITADLRKKSKYTHTCQKLYRERYLRVDVDWEKLWKFSFNGFCTNKIQQTTWLLRHFGLNTGDKVKRMYPHLNPTCKTCNSPENEDILHAFVNCQYVTPIWKHFSPIFDKILSTRFSPYQLALATYVSEQECHKNLRLAFTITCIINHTIWWQRNKNQFEKTNKKSTIKPPITISLITSTVKSTVMAYFKMHKQNDSLRLFVKDFCIESALCCIAPNMELTFNL